MCWSLWPRIQRRSHLCLRTVTCFSLYVPTLEEVNAVKPCGSSFPVNFLRRLWAASVIFQQKFLKGGVDQPTYTMLVQAFMTHAFWPGWRKKHASCTCVPSSTKNVSIKQRIRRQGCGIGEAQLQQDAQHAAGREPLQPLSFGHLEDGLMYASFTTALPGRSAELVREEGRQPGENQGHRLGAQRRQGPV